LAKTDTRHQQYQLLSDQSPPAKGKHGLLQAMELRVPTAAALYASVFTGEKLVETDRAGIPQEQWDALALVAAALEIVGPQQRYVSYWIASEFH
jgi:hypothetical protein